VQNGWRLERNRLRRMGKPTWTLRNDVLNAWAMTVVLWATLVALFGVGVLPYLLLQAVLAFSLLEAVNYLEHYGLLRQSLPNGRFERVTPRHSWNNNHLTTNLFLYHLQRHSDHHANPTRRYQALRHFEDSPQLPAGYAAMIVLCYFPPLWRRVMDRRVLAHYGGDVTLANIQPSKRAKILAKYGRPAAAAAAPAA
jgi:alkane 1-monooxygenase